MSFGWSAATWMAISVGVSTAATLYTSDQARKSQNRALAQNEREAKANQQAAEEAQNKANAKSPDVAAMLGAATLSSRAGQAGTLLTGPQGIDPNSLKLGKSTLLGGG